ncbi:MAG TPA: Calx-beta domain-containing protein, partial [Pirellulaceae bacterium]|nr:Calx-beta domain-containing protein [Pirellulaceae bacterium]
DQTLSEAHMYRTLLEADAGTLFTSAPTLVTLNAADPTAHEAGLGSATFRVTRGGDLSRPLIVNYSVGGTAVAGTDYLRLGGTVTFPANENTAFITVTPLDDATIEADETVVVTLQPGAGYSLISGATATGSIAVVSDDYPALAPTINILATDPNAAEAGRDPGIFSVTRTGGTAAAFTVDLRFGQQTASAADYDPMPVRVTFPVGQSTVNIPVRPVNDTLVENTESVVLSLAPSPIYRIGPNASARVNITSDDVAPPPAMPLVSVAATDAQASETGNDNGVFTLTRTGNLGSALVARYTAAGTAAGGTDYAPLSGFAYFAPGQATVNVVVAPYDDRAIESVETIVLRVTDLANYDVGSAGSATVRLISDEAPPVTPGNDQTSILPVLIVIGNNDFYYTEYSEPRAQLEAAGIPVVVAAGRRELSVPHSGTGYTSGNGAVMPDIALADARAENYSAILFVGGWGASQYQYAFPGVYSNATYNGSTAVREAANRLINEFTAQGKLVTAVCHGVSVLAWARVNGVSPLRDRTVSTAHFNSPTNNIPEATLYRWHSETNGATVYTGGALGNVNTRIDDVVVDGNIITGENFDSARQLGITIANRLRNGANSAVSLVATDATASEVNRETGAMSVTRTGSTAAALVVNLGVGGTATNGVDYESIPGRVLIQPGQTTATIMVRPNVDAHSEPVETVIATLAPSTAYGAGSSSSGTVSIADSAPLAVRPVLMVIANRDFNYQEYVDARAQLATAGIRVAVAAARRELSTPLANSGQGSSGGGVMPDIALSDMRGADYSAIIFINGGATPSLGGAFDGPVFSGSPQDVTRLVNLLLAR